MPNTYALTRGDRWDGPPIKVSKDAFDFTGCTVSSRIRNAAVDGKVVATLDITPVTSVANEMTFQLSMEPEQTLSLPVKTIYGDVVIERASPEFGPYTIFPFSIVVSFSQTR